MAVPKEWFFQERAKSQQDFARLAKKRPFPADIEEIADVPYLDDGDAAHRMNIYRPVEEKKPLPVVVNIHGGGLSRGSKEFNRWFNAKLSRYGFVVFCPEYRLIPENLVFAPIGDVSAAVDAANRRAEEYGGIPGRVSLVGDSAGAYLIAYAAAMQRCPEMAKAAGVTPAETDIWALGLISGMFYSTRKDAVEETLSAYMYGEGYREGGFAPYLDPDQWSCLAKMPPSILVTSAADMLHDYTTDLAASLRTAGVRTSLVDYPEDPRLTHAFSVFEPDLPESEDTIEKIAEFLLETEPKN